MSAVESGLFSELAKGSLDFESLSECLMLHPRSARDFLNALVALGMLERDGDPYANIIETDLFFDRAKPSYIGGILEMPTHGCTRSGARSRRRYAPDIHRTKRKE